MGGSRRIRYQQRSSLYKRINHTIIMGIFSALFGSKDNVPLTAAISEGAFLVDVRSPGEFASGSVKGAINIPLDALPNQLAKIEGKQNIIVFCRSGNRSSQAKAILEQNRFQQVINGGTWMNVKNALEK